MICIVLSLLLYGIVATWARSGLLGAMVFRSAPTQCEGIARTGRRCSITSHSKLRDGEGRLVAAPLQFGGRYCLFHANVFSTRKAYPEGRTLTFFLDFETTGLDVVQDSIVEVGIISESGAALQRLFGRP